LNKYLRIKHYFFSYKKNQAVGAIGPSLSELAFGPLTRILRDNSINKLTVCESLVRLGIYGEQILIDLLKNVAHANFKLKTAII
jgi:hypothetical protein